MIDADTGRILASYDFSGAPGVFVNDVVLTSTTAWFTDSHNALLDGLPLDACGTPPGPDAVIRLPLTGDLVVDPAAINANGIVRTPDGRALLIVQSNTGLLLRVDPRTGRTTALDLGGATLPNGDGLLLDGHTLYVVQNQLNRIAVVRVDDAGTTGTVQRFITSPDFDVPTTMARWGDRLYLPNARFTTPPTPTTPYTVVAVRP